ncbi:MAG: glycosyltransferase [Clostridia bacterium]|nr:glycosyltransferase [Clostridia bacterium]
MKILTVAVPCYNSEDYMEKCIDSLLVGQGRIEIIIVDDGSHDRTAEIADRYAERYPDFIRVIHQENGGHGDAVMTGLKNANGIYYKVVDSDDWFDEDAFVKVLDKLEELHAQNTAPDMMVVNYVYEKVGAHHKKVMRQSTMPVGRIFAWDDVRRFKLAHYMMMHSVIFRTDLLRRSGVDLPKHTFYVDSLFVYDPLPLVKTIYYLDVNLYRYFIGRADQSVNEEVLLRRIDQQLLVVHRMIEDVDLWQVESKKCRLYMRNFLEILMTICSVLLLRDGSDEALKKKDALWAYLKQHDEKLYRILRRRFLGRAMNLRTKLGRKIGVWGYLTCQKIFGFN